MKNLSYFLTTILLVISNLLIAQNLGNQFWVEGFYENSIGTNFNLKQNQMIYRLEYLKHMDISIVSDKEFRLNRIDGGVEYIIPYDFVQTDITVGAGIGYLFGKHYNEIDSSNPRQPKYEVSDYSSIAGTASFKFNYYFSEHLGIGLGAKGSLANDYTNVAPQVRILFGRLR